MNKVVMAFLSIALLWSEFASAQKKPILQVMVEDTNEAATRCGITKSGIESIAALTLRNNGIQATTAVTDPYLYVVVTALSGSSSACLFNTLAQVRTIVPMPLNRVVEFKNRKSPNFASALLCSSGGVATTSQGRAAIYVQEVLESDIKDCLGKLEY